MPRYIYTAKPEPNKTAHGDLEAESEQDAINKLTRMGYFPISVEAESSSFLEKPQFLSFRKISNKDIVLFTRQLSSLIESGINILTGLNIIYNQTENKYFKVVLYDVVSKIKDGRPLSESLAQHPGIFSNLYTSMIRSGETGGTLEPTLKRMADFMEKEEEFRNSVRAALTYPIFVFCVGVLTVIVLLGFVIPRLVSMFEDMGQSLPLPTRILINLSASLRSYWWLIITCIGIIVFILRRVYATQQGRLFFDKLKLRLIIFGNIILKTEISRFMRTLSLLLSSGITIVYALDLSSSVVQNQVLSEQIQKFKERINQGANLSSCLKDSKLFPVLVTNILSIAEETGTLEKSLLRVADDYEREIDRSLKELSRLLEPIIILLVGLIVGFIVLSMLLPIFQINLMAR